MSNHIDRVKEAKTVRKIVLIVISILIILLIIGIASAFFYVKSSLKPVDKNDTEKVTVEVPLGSSSSSIATILEEHGLIKNDKIFRFYVKFKNYSDFQAGEYELSPSMGLDEIAQELQTGLLQEEPLFRITIPEGKNLEEIAEITANKLDFTEEDFIDTVEDTSFLKEMEKSYPNLITDDIFNDDLYMALEGYLYAGTYDVFDEEMKPEQLIEQMLERTNDLIVDDIDEVEDADFSVHEILTLASVIERESKYDEDRPKVAQVYMNRLDEDMKLQSDITAFYGIKNIEHKSVVTYDDIEVETPYNTYVIDGLPVGPIASPSEDAIKAVLKPEGEDFNKLFYFSRPNGETFYADTLEEHNEIKEKYRQEWYDLENEDSDDKDDKENE